MVTLGSDALFVALGGVLGSQEGRESTEYISYSWLLVMSELSGDI